MLIQVPRYSLARKKGSTVLAVILLNDQLSIVLYILTSINKWARDQLTKRIRKKMTNEITAVESAYSFCVFVPWQWASSFHREFYEDIAGCLKASKSHFIFYLHYWLGSQTANFSFKSFHLLNSYFLFYYFPINPFIWNHLVNMWVTSKILSALFFAIIACLCYLRMLRCNTPPYFSCCCIEPFGKGQHRKLRHTGVL